jgi:hypothetical protein
MSTAVRSAKLNKTPLYPSETLKPDKGLKPGPIFPDAIIQDTGLYGAKYDSSTRWPDQIVDPAKVGAVYVEERSQYTKIARVFRRS